MRDPYSVLGVAKTAKPEEIKSAYRKLAKKYHPDQNPDDPKAQERFSEATQAYDILSDKERRGQFDRGEIDAEGKPTFQGFHPGAGAGAAGGDPFAEFARRAGAGGRGGGFEFRTGPGGFSGGGAEDILNDLFGGAFGGGAAGARPRGRQQAKGADLMASIEITLEQAAGAEKVEAIFPNGKRLSIKLPKYVEDGQTIRLKGQGEAMLGGTPGDALVTIRFGRHPRFKLEGRDVHLDLPVSLSDAVLGARIEVETLDGRIAVKVPPWSSSDRVLRLKGKGLPMKAGDRADLFVHVRVMLPEGGDPELEAFLRQRAG
ncbi:molecular chaperone DnaJ [Paramesorhizobium deserti]|uniref:Molecular chaperone DnaJ n=1 Tax=Paramesorhizobium deserti TaxID=1494590 RepID=A0A135HYV4_9HYPH|nr:DnaJ C-terminal domain-containing protein [Paramesorhizobium deserti]KXF78394.1 molecular chaperone DnaJ [Paramesorhizobium deserti]